MTKNVSESGETLMGIEDASGANSENELPTQLPPQSSISRRNSQIKASERRGSEAKVLQLNVDNTWATVNPKSNTKLKTSVEKMSAVVRRGWKPEVWYKTFVGIFFVVIALLIGTTTFLYNRQKYLQAFKDKIYVVEEKRNFFLLDSNGNELLKANFGANIPGDIKPLNCFSINGDGRLSQICREWQYRAHFSIDYEHKSNGISCYNVRWKSYDSLGTGLKDCFELKNGFWFGMGLVRNLSWPLTNVSLKYSAFVTGNKLSESAPFGSIIKRYWLSSKGISIQVPLNIPLYVSFNASDEYGNFDNRLCLESRTNDYPYNSMSSSRLPQLEYTVCTGNSVIELHTEASKNWTQVLMTSAKSSPQKEHKGTKRAQNISPSIVMKEIFWTTATELFPNVTQIALQSYADKIMSYGFEPGIIVLDSRWESHTGDMTINRTNFQNPGALFSVLHYKGFKIMVTVTPFIDITADSLVSVSSEKRVFVDKFTNATLFTTCKESPKHLCALLDLLNSTTREWFQHRLRNAVVKELGVNGLMFKGVPVTLMPLHRYNYKPSMVNPDYYQLHYRHLAEYTTNLVGLDTSAGIGMEGFYQISPLNASWTSLRSIVPTVLTLGLIGYGIIHTGSVGGDVFVNPKEFDRELYIRWLELAAFLPIVQFAEPPGRDELEIIRMAKKFLKVREEHILPILQTSLEEYKLNGWPIIRPMWWLEPDDQDAYLINDQFAIGNDVIVAPILEQGVLERDIYLPSGWWRDDSAQVMRGGKWVRKYHVDVDKVPYFKRTDPNA